jgi:hypothetical protein
MKARLVVFTFLLLLLTSVPVLSQERMHLTRYLYGYRYTTKVSDTDLEKMPSWNPETEEAPVSARKAVEVARISLKRLLPQETEKWDLLNVNLSPLTKNKWIYEIEFKNDDLVPSDRDFCFSIFVKMDVTIVEPEIVPNDGKLRIY